MKDIYQSFEFDLIKKKIEKYARGEIALEKIRNLKMFSSQVDLVNELKYLEETLSYTYKYRSLVITPHKDLTSFFLLLKKDGVGNIDFFYQVSSLLENANTLLNESVKDESYPLLLSLIRKLEPCESLKHTIERIITPDLDIADSASSTLREIRRSIRNEEASQQRIMSSLLIKYKDILNDERVTMRNSSYALPIKSAYKGKIEGAIVDMSDTGNTSFIEPYEIIASNAKIQRLKEKEHEEIHRILYELSRNCEKYLPSLQMNQEVISYLDFLLAKANYAIEINASVASISNERKIAFKGARHPLLDQNKVVKNSFLLNKQKIMLITGPNAGGKTVAIKTIGLLILMSECGLAIPVDEVGEHCFFKDIFVDIGDNQSLMDNLSTFSGHISKIVKIVSEVSYDSLVILDELGTGTSPLDGEAIALGVINRLHDVGCFSIITSHYDGIKAFALEHDYILNSSMEFDEQNIVPTYRLRLGVAGKSYGLEVGQRLGLDKRVLDFASDYINQKIKTDKEITMKMLQDRIEENERISYALEEKLKEVEKEKEELIRQQDILKRKREDLVKNANEEKMRLIEEAKEQIDSIVEEFKKNGEYKLHEVIKSKKKLDDQIEYDEDERENASINVGDQVRINDSAMCGKVIQIKGNNVRILTDQGMNVNAKLNNIHKVKKEKKKEKLTYVSPFKSETKVPLECNIIGMYCEEGIAELDRYLDSAIAASYSQVRIVHGSGTGKLRSAVHEYLKKRKEVKSFRLGGIGEGGVGATVVYLK